MASDAHRLNAFPVFMRVEGEAVTVVGGGAAAFAKARLIAQTSARLSVVIVAGSFSAWAYGAERDSHPGYSVTITQLQ